MTVLRHPIGIAMPDTGKRLSEVVGTLMDIMADEHAALLLEIAKRIPDSISGKAALELAAETLREVRAKKS